MDTSDIMDIPRDLSDAVDAVAPELIAIPGVTGVGLGLREDNGELVDELAVRILIADALEVPEGIPESVAGLSVSIVEFPVEPLAVTPDTTRYDDLPGGTQIQPVPEASGTLGAIAQDGNGVEVGLTCHHVSGGSGTTLWQPTAPMIIAGGPPVDLASRCGPDVHHRSHVHAQQQSGSPLGRWGSTECPVCTSWGHGRRMAAARRDVARRWPSVR